MQNPEVRKKSQRRYCYNGIHFDSSYELALFIWLIDNNIDFEYQPNVSIQYADQTGKVHSYCPDFRIEGFLYELKGQQFIAEDGTWRNPYDAKSNNLYEAKHQCCLKHQVKILLSSECEKFIEYVKDKYGKDFLQNFRSQKNDCLQKTKAEMNPYFRDRKLENLLDIKQNIYFKSNPEFFKELKELVEKFPKSYTRKLEAGGRRDLDAGIEAKLPFKHLMEWIESCLPFLSEDFYKTSTKVTWILYGLVDFPRCATCKSNEKFKRMNVTPFKGYPKHCSIKCGCLDQETSSKIKRTKKMRHGDENFVNPQKARATAAKKIKEDPTFLDNAAKKRKKTCLECFGAENPMQSLEVKNKRKDANLREHGVQWYTQSKEFKMKTQATMLQKHGVEWFVQSDEFKDKAKKTWIENLGVDSPSKSHEVLAKILQKYHYDGKFFSSAPEIAYYIWLKDNNIDFTYQPKCDIYYEFNGKKHKYFPDFLVEGRLVELKGDQFLKEDGTWQNPFDHSQDQLYEAKHQCCIRNNVLVVFSEDYKRFLDYVDQTYGKDFLHSLRCQRKNLK